MCVDFRSNEIHTEDDRDESGKTEFLSHFRKSLLGEKGMVSLWKLLEFLEDRWKEKSSRKGKASCKKLGSLKGFYLCEHGSEIHPLRGLSLVEIVLYDAKETAHKAKACLGPQRKKN